MCLSDSEGNAYKETEDTEFIKQCTIYQRGDVDRINSDRITDDPKITSTSKKQSGKMFGTTKDS
jgi:hypothetical protein